MWSVGCIIAEMMMRRPLINGRNTMDQLILSVCLDGTVTRTDCSTISNVKQRDAVQQQIEYQSRSTSTPSLKDYMLSLCPDLPIHYPRSAWDLLGNLLRFRPKERLSSSEALQHPYLQYRNNEKRPDVLFQGTVVQDLRKDLFDSLEIIELHCGKCINTLKQMLVDETEQ